MTMSDSGMIRSIELSHIASIAHLEGQLFDRGLDRAGLQSLCAGPAFTGLVYGDEPLAYLLAHVTADDAEILSLGTAPSQQRQGMAGALCQYFISGLIAKKKTALFLEVAADNIAAMALYKKHGFQQIAVRKAYYLRGGDRVDAIVMRHALGAAFS